MTTARIEPLGETILLRAGETLMRAGQRAGLRWPTLCQGQGLCAQCWVKVTAGGAALGEPSTRELRALRIVPAPHQGPDTRLACQIAPDAPITVSRVQIVRDSAPTSAPAPSDDNQCQPTGPERTAE